MFNYKPVLALSIILFGFLISISIAFLDILGPSEMIYSPDKPRKCGARLWIETDSEVVIHNKTTYREMTNDNIS